jgi:hypothetical protein
LEEQIELDVAVAMSCFDRGLACNVRIGSGRQKHFGHVEIPLAGCPH